VVGGSQFGERFGEEGANHLLLLEKYGRIRTGGGHAKARTEKQKQSGGGACNA